MSKNIRDDLAIPINAQLVGFTARLRDTWYVDSALTKILYLVCHAWLVISMFLIISGRLSWQT